MSKIPKKHKCSKCNKMATWVYLPSSHGRMLFCDDCVSRGCTCNVMDLGMEEPDECVKDRTIWWSKDAYKKCICEKVEAIDYSTKEKGRRQPCIEFDYSPNGYEIEGNFYGLTVETLDNVFNKTLLSHEPGNKSMTDGISMIMKEFSKENDVIPYNEFMYKVTEFCRPYTMHTNIITADRKNLKFCNSFRSQLYDRKIPLKKTE